MNGLWLLAERCVMKNDLNPNLQNIQAEVSLIGALLRDPNQIKHVIEKLNTEDFYFDEYAIIYEVIFQLYESKRSIDMMIVIDELLRKFPNNTKLEGTVYECVKTVPEPSNAPSYANIVRECSARRNEIKELDAKKDRILNAEENVGWSSRSAELIFRKCSDIEAKPIHWLWPGRIARGKLTMIAGNPGLGKSQLTVDIAAIVSTGGQWPVDHALCESGNVLILSAEDGAEDTLRPRLEAAEANLDKIFIIDAVKESSKEGVKHRSFNLKVDIERLAQVLEKTTNVAAIFIDPLTSYLGEVDSHKTADVRALLSPLSKLAEKYNTAIICVSHLNKGGSTEALMRVTGSLGFVAAARAAYVVTGDKDDKRKRLLLPLKNNLGNDETGFAFNVEPCCLGNGIPTSRIRWLSEIVTITANEAVAAQSELPKSKNTREEEKEFLREMLVEGPKSAEDIKRNAAEAGYSWRTIERAKKDLEIKPIRIDGHWVWPLISKAANTATENNVAVLAKSGSLDQTVTCSGCQYFEVDKIGNGAGIGSCTRDAWTAGKPLLYPNAERFCNQYKQKELQ